MSSPPPYNASERLTRLISRNDLGLMYQIDGWSRRIYFVILFASRMSFTLSLPNLCCIFEVTSLRNLTISEKHCGTGQGSIIYFLELRRNTIRFMFARARYCYRSDPFSIIEHRQFSILVRSIHFTPNKFNDAAKIHSSDVEWILQFINESFYLSLGQDTRKSFVNFATNMPIFVPDIFMKSWGTPNTGFSLDSKIIRPSIFVHHFLPSSSSPYGSFYKYPDNSSFVVVLPRWPKVYFSGNGPAMHIGTFYVCRPGR